MTGWRPRVPLHLLPATPTATLPVMGPVVAYLVDVEVIGGARSTVAVTAPTSGRAHLAAIAAARTTARDPRAAVIVHGYRTT